MDKDNITFLLEEKNIHGCNGEYNNEDEINKIMTELNDGCWREDANIFGTSNTLIYKDLYGNDELYYNQECTIKELMKICQYYGIEKNIKSAKCKKQDIISTIVYFESQPENVKIVQQRNIMWAYITELMNDQKMKKYIIWN